MSQRRAYTVEAYRAALLAGGQDPRRVARAEGLALLACVAEMLWNRAQWADEKHAQAVRAMRAERDRAWPVGPFFELGLDGKRRKLSWDERLVRRRTRRRPLYLAETYRAIEAAAAARAAEAEWYAVLVSLIERVPPDAPRRRQVVIYGNDGKPRVLFARGERVDDDTG